MNESLTQFRRRLTRKAILNFRESQNVTLKEFNDFVNYKTGTEIHDQFITDCYEYFIKKREKLKDGEDAEEF